MPHVPSKSPTLRPRTIHLSCKTGMKISIPTAHTYAPYLGLGSVLVFSLTLPIHSGFFFWETIWKDFVSSRTLQLSPLILCRLLACTGSSFTIFLGSLLLRHGHSTQVSRQVVWRLASISTICAMCTVLTLFGI